MALAAASSLAFVNSSGFKNEYDSVDYSFGTVGESGFSFAWVDLEKNPFLMCQEFEYCSFIDIDRAVPCTTSIEIEVAFLDATDKQLFKETNHWRGSLGVNTINIEIGTNRQTDFEWFVIDDIYCKGELRTATSVL
jgi:hypothetical protein